MTPTNNRIEKFPAYKAGNFSINSQLTQKGLDDA